MKDEFKISSFIPFDFIPPPFICDDAEERRQRHHSQEISMGL